MSCCGQQRASLKESRTIASQDDNPSLENNPHTRSRESEVRFRYIGNSGIHLKGAISFRKYFFGSKGDVVLVDERDAPAFSAVADLQKL
ncbi:MAG: hypothetical protein R6W31_00875 [Bacteroidales bacterium]